MHVYVYVCNSMVRATRGASAIGRGAREQVIAKFDLAWKNHIITQILMEDDSMLDRRVVTSGPSSTTIGSSGSGSGNSANGSGLTIPAVVGILESSYNTAPSSSSSSSAVATIASTSGSGSVTDDGSGKGQDWTPEGEERTAMRREWRDV
jgi:hypothetical protein